jgi:hypothetical protein
MTEAVHEAPRVAQANRRLLLRLLVVALGMFAFGFALVPFYETICEVTGIRNVFQPDAPLAQNSQVDATRDITSSSTRTPSGCRGASSRSKDRSPSTRARSPRSSTKSAIRSTAR